MNEFYTAFMLSQNPIFVGRMVVAIIKTAVAVYNEDKASPNHANRASLATSVLRDPINHAENFAVVVAATGTDLSVESSDQELLNVISSVWNALAG